MATWDGILIVDVSNVCRARRPPTWEAYECVASSWEQQFGRPREVVLIADRSLKAMLSKSREPSSARFAELVQQGKVQVVPKADDLILRRAELALQAEDQFAVISNDRFILEAAEHPWLIGDEDHFFHARTQADGSIRFEQRHMVFTVQTYVARVEASELRELGFADGARDPRLAREYRCDNGLCWVHQLKPERLLGLPAVGPTGSVVCPGCKDPLADLGPRPTRRRIVVQLAGAARPVDLSAGFIMSAGTEVQVGRTADPAAGVVGLSQFGFPEADLGVVSRRHVLLRLSKQGKLQVTDLGSTNGTVLQRRGYGSVVEDEVGLEPHAPMEVNRRDRLILAGAAWLELSGESSPRTL